MLLAVNPVQLTWTTIAAILGSVAVIVLLIWAIGKLIPSSKKYGSAGGNALMKVDTLFRPSRQHIIEAREREDKKDEESGDPPSS